MNLDPTLVVALIAAVPLLILWAVLMYRGGEGTDGGGAGRRADARDADAEPKQTR